jgi:hypothetical protein
LFIFCPIAAIWATTGHTAPTQEMAFANQHVAERSNQVESISVLSQAAIALSVNLKRKTPEGE